MPSRKLFSHIVSIWIMGLFKNTAKKNKTKLSPCPRGLIQRDKIVACGVHFRTVTSHSYEHLFIKTANKIILTIGDYLATIPAGLLKSETP